MNRAMSMPVQATRAREDVPEVQDVNGRDVTDDWFRQHEPQSVHAGKRAHYPRSMGGGHEFNNWEYLTHYDGPRHLDGPAIPLFEQGLRLTRFKKGMFRRNYRDIGQDKEELAMETKKEAARVEHLERRRLFLQQQDKKNGFNVVNGAETIPYKWRPSVRPLPGAVSHNLAREGLIKLRDSSDRFYIPHYSGPAHDYRQKVMNSEGLLKPKLSAVIGVGKPEMSSFGVEDQFSHSNYTPKDPIKVTGLYESTQPGVFTPQKFPQKTAQYLYPLNGRPNSGSSIKPKLGPVPSTPQLRSAPSTAAVGRRSHTQHNEEVAAVRALP